MRRDRHIFAAGLLLSVGAHAAAFGVFRALPAAEEATATKAEPLALIAIPAPPEALPLEAVRPILPTPRVPAPEEPPEPAAAVAPAAEPAVTPAAVAPPVPAPAAPAQPVTVAPPPPTPPELAARRLAQGRYENTVTQWVERQRAYPLAARRRGWEGTAIVRLRLATDGSLLTAQLVRDTGFALLDEAALGMVRRAAPFPRLPEEIGESDLEVLIPIHFSLGNSD